MKKTLLLFSLLLHLFGYNSSAQDATTETVEPTKKDSLTFPDSWLGNWVGDLEIHNVKGLAQTLPMELEMAKMDSSDNYIWAIIYGEDKVAGRRAYELEIVDPAKGLYVVDEKNTIKLESYLIANKLICRFEVEGTYLISTYELADNKMIFEIIAGSATAVSSTGGEVFEGEEIPVVNTFPVNVVQRGVLKKIMK